MRYISIFAVLLSAIYTATTLSTNLNFAKECDKDACKLPKCRCYKDIPNIPIEKTPQIVVISSDDAVTKLNFDTLYKPLYFNRTNPDKCNIGVTFFVPHEWTDYGKVHALWANGFEIAVNTITKTPNAEYWMTASEELLIEEFGGQKEILLKFAGVATDEIRGGRTPLLQLKGDTTYSALENSSLNYDNTWTTRDITLWPYTLDYASHQECLIGSCPLDVHKNMWILPINDWLDMENVSCATIHGCRKKPNDTVVDIYNWLKSNFDRVYSKNKIPFNIVLASTMFYSYKSFHDAYVKFLDHLQSLNDVYIVNQWQALEWIQNPKPIGDKNIFTCNKQHPHNDKLERVCPVKKDDDIRYMTIYDAQCPKVYPWIGNPDGN